MIWIGIAFFIVGFIINFFVSDEKLGVYVGTILACIGTLMLHEAKIKDVPSAMDVYQGKTTLEITYKDGVAIDSIVVFKDKEK